MCACVYYTHDYTLLILKDAFDKLNYYKTMFIIWYWDHTRDVRRQTSILTVHVTSHKVCAERLAHFSPSVTNSVVAVAVACSWRELIVKTINDYHILHSTSRYSRHTHTHTVHTLTACNIINDTRTHARTHTHWNTSIGDN